MAKYVVTINEKTEMGKGLLALMKSMKNIVSIEKPESERKPNATTKKALKDANNDKVIRAKNKEDFFKTLES